MNITNTYRTRLVAAAATGLLALSLGAGTAMAKTTGENIADVEDTSVTINGLQANDTVSAWSIADALIDSTNNLTYTMASGLPEAYDSVEELAAITSDSDAAKEAANAIAAVLVGSNATVTATANDGGAATLTLDSGYYLVTVTSTSGKTVLYQNMLIDATPTAGTDGNYGVRTISDVTVKKSDVTAPDKKVVEGTGENSSMADSTDSYSVGDTATFQITGVIPSYPSNATNATYRVTDTPASGLEVDDATFAVTMGSGESAKKLVKDTDFTVSSTDGKYTINFSNPISLAGQTYTITYSAKVTAVDATDGTVTNKAHATFNPNPYVDSTVDTGDDPATVKTYGFVFTKVGGTDQDPLPGAQFQVKDAAGNVVKDASGSEITLTSDENGYVYLGGLESGTYTITETKVPAGYQKVEDFTVTLDKTTANTDNPATGSITETNYLVKAEKVVDPKQGVLPTTGGEGTVALTAAGVVLMAGAAGFVVLARRRNSNR